MPQHGVTPRHRASSRSGRRASRLASSHRDGPGGPGRRLIPGCAAGSTPAVASTPADASQLTRGELDQVLQALSPDDQSGRNERDGTALETFGRASSTLWDLAQQAGSAERYLLRTLPVSA